MSKVKVSSVDFDEAEKEKKPNVKNKNSNNWKKLLIIVFLSFALFVLMISGVFFGYEKVYAGKFLSGVMLAGVDVGGKTIEEAKVLLDSQIQKITHQKLSLSAEDETLNPTMDELGVTFDSKIIVDQAFQIGRDKSTWNRFVEDLKTIFYSKEVLLHPQVNAEKFNNYINNNTKLNKDAKNATLKIESNKVVLVLSESGSKVDIEKFNSDLNNNISLSQISHTIILKINSIDPEIDEDQVSSIKPQVEQIVNQPISFTSDTKNFVADSNTIAEWIVLKSNGHGGVDIQFSDEKIKEFIGSISHKTDQKKVDKQINDQTNAVISEGNDGLELNQTKLMTDIKNILNNPDSASRTISLEINTTPRDEKRIQPQDISQSGGTPGLYDGRYIEVNLSEQKLYAFEGTNFVGAYAVSTGKWSMPTPIGTRYIESKDPRAYSSKYNLYMPYWNSIGGGYGIHELPEWANGAKEGENHLGTPVSHGCIRLGVGPAEFIYNWAPVGTPVYIHK